MSGICQGNMKILKEGMLCIEFDLLLLNNADVDAIPEFSRILDSQRYSLNISAQFSSMTCRERHMRCEALRGGLGIFGEPTRNGGLQCWRLEMKTPQRWRPEAKMRDQQLVFIAGGGLREQFLSSLMIVIGLHVSKMW